MNFKGAAKPLTPAGLTLALAAIDFALGEAAFLWTVIEVETSGVTQGFGFRDDRRPHILFERHKFRQFTNGQFDAILHFDETSAVVPIDPGELWHDESLPDTWPSGL